MLGRTLILIGLLAGAPLLHAQASSTASRRGDLQIGGGYTSADSDYRPARFNGGAAYVDFDFTHRFGAEGEFHFVRASDGSNDYEKTYEIGGRYHRAYGRFVPYAKFLYGRGVYNYNQPFQTNPPDGPITYLQVANLAYNLAAGGIGVDYRVLPRINIRADWEYQHWFSFQSSSLTPNLITIGAAYHFK